MPRVFEYDVFLSFSSDDEKIAKPVWQELCLNGLRVFWSDSTLKNKLGESWFDAIESSLESSQHLVLLCSPNSMSSEWVKREYKAFLNHCYKPGTRKLIPVLVGNFKASNLPLFLKEFEACQLDESDALKKLVSILGGIDIEELRILLVKKNEENNLLREELNAANSRIALLQQDASELSAEISNLKNEKDLLKRQLHDSGSEIKRLRQKLSKASSENSRLKLELEKANSQIPSKSKITDEILVTIDPKKEKIINATLAEIYAAQSQFSKAIAVYEILLKREPSNEIYKQKIEYLKTKLIESDDQEK